jgi:primary-amine oxidase
VKTFIVALTTLVIVGSACRDSRVAASVEGLHPLSQLSGDEIQTAIQVLRKTGKVSAATLFPFIVLKEPDKTAVLNGNRVPREVKVTTLDRSRNKTAEAVVNVTSKSLVSWKDIPGVQPALLGEDSDLAADIVRQDAKWISAIRKRGIINLNDVSVDAWSAGYFGLPEEEGVRVSKVLSYFRGNLVNYYARPIEGVVAYVDLTHRRVIKVVDTGVVPIPTETSEYDRRSMQPRPSLKPLKIVQDSGSSARVQGGEVTWDKWRFRFAMNAREGLVLYTVRYSDGGKERPILYRGSLSEMVVPYASADAAWFFRNSFDAGELGVGRAASTLRKGVECPENATLFDAVMADDFGSPQIHKDVVALYERDRMMAWKHGDEARRGRELILQSISTVGNYDYSFSWVFQQDGTIEMRVGLTGIMSVRAVKSGGDSHSMTGHLVAKNLEAVHHQHFFCFRLDMDVDGPNGNTVIEQNTESDAPGKSNPYGGAFHMMETALRTDTEARRQVNLLSSRRWKIVTGNSGGYTLLPGENAVSFAAPGSWIRKRAGFLNAHLWVTPFSPDELYAAGDYPNQSRGGEGLVKWTAINRAISGKDVVVWYTMGITHLPRPEDWPVMPVHEAGFKLIPTGFFPRNPALDLP